MMSKSWREFSMETFSSSDTPQIVHAFFDEEDSTAYNNILSEEEKNRAARLKNKHAAHQSIISHGILRRVLGRAARVEPSALRFEFNPYKKPLLSHPKETGITFNLSHSGNILLIALSKGFEVGVDVEKVNPNRAFSVIEPQVFSPSEQAQCANSANPVRDFYILWTAKEALLKAAGCGFAFSPKNIPLEIEQGRAILTSLPPALSEHKKWLLNTFNPSVGYIAAVASLSG